MAEEGHLVLSHAGGKAVLEGFQGRALLADHSVGGRLAASSCLASPIQRLPGRQRCFLHCTKHRLCGDLHVYRGTSGCAAIVPSIQSAGCIIGGPCSQQPPHQSRLRA